MKKILILAVILITILFPKGVLAYEDEYINIEIPSEYVLQEDNSNGKTSYLLSKTYKRAQTEEILVMNCVRYNGSRKNLSSLTQSDLDDFTNSFVEAATQSTTSGERKPVVQEKRIDKIANYDCIYIKVQYEETKYYIEVYAILSDNYLYSFMVSAEDNNYFNNTEYTDIKNSINIKDTVSDYGEETFTPNLDSAKIVGSILGYATPSIILVIIIIVFVTSKKKKSE